MTYRIDNNGNVTITNCQVPIPKGVSAEAQAFLAQAPWEEPPVQSEPIPMWLLREHVDQQTFERCEAAREIYPVKVEALTIAGVRCQLVSPLVVPEQNAGKLLINLHGGGFVLGGGSLIEAIPIAHVAKIPVLAIDYRLAPEYVYPDAVDDVIAVYRAMLEQYQPSKIGIFGASAGAYLTSQAVRRIHREGLSQPACCGVFTGGADFSDLGESAHIFTLQGFWGDPLPPMNDPLNIFRVYIGSADATDPDVSPIKGDLTWFPPTLLVTGTRDFLMSATASLHRALRRANVEAELYVFEAMPHAHWYMLDLPESREAIELMADYFLKQLGRAC